MSTHSLTALPSKRCSRSLSPGVWSGPSHSFPANRNWQRCWCANAGTRFGPAVSGRGGGPQARRAARAGRGGAGSAVFGGSLSVPSSVQTTAVLADTSMPPHASPNPEPPSEAPLQFLTHRNHDMTDVYCLWPPSFGVICYTARAGSGVKRDRSLGHSIWGPAPREHPLHCAPSAPPVLALVPTLCLAAQGPPSLPVSPQTPACMWGSLGLRRSWPQLWLPGAM